MKKQTKIRKAQLFYLKQVASISGAKTITQLSRESSVDRNLIAKLLRKYEPELYVRLNSQTDVRMIFDIDFSKVEPTDYVSTKYLKLERFVSLLKSGLINKTELACELNVCRATIYVYIKLFLQRYAELENRNT